MLSKPNSQFKKLPDFLLPLVPYRRILIFVFHLGLFALAYVAAYGLRFEGLLPEQHLVTMFRTMPLVVLLQAATFFYHDLYQGLWRYASFADVQNILRATLLSLVILFIVQLAAEPYLGRIPNSIYILDGLLVAALTCGPRFLVRHLRQRFPVLTPHRKSRRVLLVGPVEAAEPLLREMLQRGNDYYPVALVEPSPQWRGSRLMDVPIVGGLRNLADTAARYGAQEIIFAWPEAPQDTLNDLVTQCKRAQLACKIVPPLGEILQGRFRLADVRDIELEDLLPRPPIHIDQEKVKSQIQDRVVLVTGAGGSIGSELCRQLAAFKPATLIMLERAENALYAMEVELKRRFPDLAFQALVASINDGPGLMHLFQELRPQIVFHAAAYKHVPLMERCPIEAAYNNILGTRNVAQASLTAGVDRFVLISTDKAVNPTSVMGVTKRIAEKYVQSLNGPGRTRFIITRFGNVLGSAGSVIPIFKEQLAQGGPLTVTHPEIERFFMTIPEAVQLVLQAAVMGEGGDIFVLNMGRSVKIRELAEKLILLAGHTPGNGIDIVYTGLRPGEKMYEELFNHDEEPHPTEHPMIFRAVASQEPREKWESFLHEVEILVRSRAIQKLLVRFKEVLPNYDPLLSNMNTSSLVSQTSA